MPLLKDPFSAKLSTGRKQLEPNADRLDDENGTFNLTKEKASRNKFFVGVFLKTLDGKFSK